VAHIIDDFFEGQLTIWRIRIPKRLLVPFLLVLGAKIAGAVIVYSLLNIQASGTFWFDPSRVFNLRQNDVFILNANTPRWAYAFVGWDSAWYLSIMTRGYSFSSNSYAFSPGFPIFGSLFTYVFGNPLVSAALCSLVFGVLWVPVFQLVAEYYISKKAAFGSVLLFAFSPYVFLYTTVVYSEGLFLFSTLGAWYLFKKSQAALSSGLAAISVLARFMGAVLVLPMLLVSVRKRKPARTLWIVFSLLPLVALVSWLAYCQFTANDFLAVGHTTEWNTFYSVRTLLLEGLPQRGLNVFQDGLLNSLTPLNWLSPFAIVAALVVPPFLIYRMIKIEKSLALYSLVCYVWLLMVGAIASLPRYNSVLFPLWIPLAAGLSTSKKSIAFLTIASTIAFIISLSLWADFLSGVFVA
jgi:4-amino-4-deoxy-L-arabinose transferase-like glycosyltransferase